MCEALAVLVTHWQVTTHWLLIICLLLTHVHIPIVVPHSHPRHCC